ncbi:hypothetical protein Tco_1089675 [Tanacetum coccineum]
MRSASISMAPRMTSPQALLPLLLWKNLKWTPLFNLGSLRHSSSKVGCGTSIICQESMGSHYRDCQRHQTGSRTFALKAELRSIKLGDLSIDAYFRKIESIATILTSLGSLVSSEDVVNLALEGFPDKYDNVCGIIHHQEHFLNLKTARSML